MKEDKIRITCKHCLYSKLMNRHQSDPERTRFIFTESCEQCNIEGSGIYYYDSELTELESEHTTTRTTTDRDRSASPNIQFLIKHSEKCLSEPIAFIGSVDEQKGYKKCLTENIEFLKLYSSVLTTDRDSIVEKCVEAVCKEILGTCAATLITIPVKSLQADIRTALRTVLNPEG